MVKCFGKIEIETHAMKLPKINPNEELEVLSNNYFEALFSVKKFELRKETKDKGIDFRIELKHSGLYTGFNFLIQLKATESIKKNKAGLISIQIDTSNINYLLNSGLPAYYVLYSKDENEFFYENISTFANHLSNTKPDWQNQNTHVLQFKEKLTDQVIDEIYIETYRRGQFLRTIQDTLTISSSLLSERIIVDPDLNVVSDSEIRRLIEKFGLYLINEGRWREVLVIHKKGSQQVATTAKYNLVLGISHFYTGELLNALVYIKSAYSLLQELPINLQEHLKLFDAVIKFSLGLFTKSEYEIKLKELEKSDHLRFYIKVEDIKREYLSGEGNINERFLKFIDEMNSILQSNEASNNIKLMVRCELILFKGSKINVNYAQQITQIRASEEIFGKNNYLRQMGVRNMLTEKLDWAKEVNDIKEEALGSKNYLTYFHAVLHEVKVNYEFEAYTDLFEIDNPAILAMSTERKDQIDQMIDNVRNAIKYYNQISDIQNLCLALSLLYEICHYKEDFQQATIALDQLSELVEKYDIRENKPKVEALRAMGATHQKLRAFVDSMSEKAEKEHKEYLELIHQMQKWDDLDLENPLSVLACEQIQLHPIGYFEFPKKDRHKVYMILKINENVWKDFDYMLDKIGAIPIANILHGTVSEEGYGEEVSSINSIESWRNIHRIRDLFFQNKFRRFVPKVPNASM